MVSVLWLNVAMRAPTVKKLSAMVSQATDKCGHQEEAP